MSPQADETTNADVTRNPWRDVADYGRSATIDLPLFCDLECGLRAWKKKLRRYGLPKDTETCRDFLLSLTPEEEQIFRIIRVLQKESFFNEAYLLRLYHDRLNDSLDACVPLREIIPDTYCEEILEDKCVQSVVEMVQGLRNARQKLMNHRIPEELTVLNSPNVFAKKTDWMIRYGRDPTFLSDTLMGPVYIQHLLKHQKEDIHVARMLMDISGDERFRSILKPGNLLDPESIQELKTEFEELKAEQAKAEKNQDMARKTAADEKLEEMEILMGQSLGLFSRSRQDTDGVVRIRRNISRVIGTAYDKIKQNDPNLVSHLRKTVRTSLHMTYNPERWIDWVFE
ncbi:MAG: hypothetical protein QGG42_04320 [Phycisphaerae bacterium]|jgi:hypothetical protein|nr:hypothetical protein [Phycisphaerae bacterium]